MAEDIGKQETEKKETRKKRAAKKKKMDLVTMIIMIIGILCMVFAAWNLYRIMYDYYRSNALYDDIEDEYVIKTEDTEAEEIPWYELASVNLDDLKAVNPDVVGWIFFENEDISYPVLYSGDNSTYLRTSIDKQPATAGSIFIEGKNHPNFEDSHTIIYGHNMRNLSMFGKLKYYKNEGYYDDHVYFQIFKDNLVYRYQIFAFADVAADSYVYTVPYGPDETFGEFINKLYKSSYQDTGVIASQTDKIVTLSTCSTGDNRFVVHAVRVDAHVFRDEQE